MKVFYSAIFRRDKEDPKWWNVSIPDVWGAVTCGDSFENAKYMAKDLLKTIYRLAPEQLGFPTTLEEIQSRLILTRRDISFMALFLISEHPGYFC